jgi:ribonucleoside-diphosphate reductase alpha chain
MQISSKILSDITVFAKYAKHIPVFERRETWEEICERNMQMHIKKYPAFESDIRFTYENFVVTKKILPSMRSLQFAGKPIDVAPNRIYNCAYLPVDSLESFSESMFLLLGGTGVGYSVQKHHVEKLPDIKGPSSRRKRFLVADNIEGWADAIKVLMASYFHGKMLPDFDFSDIRQKGAPLITSGGKAPGPQPLKDCVHNITKVLDAAITDRGAGTKLTTLETHDIMCFIADAVLAGGIRRAALIALFSLDDELMLTCKHGAWYELNPQRGRANNSAVILRHKVQENDFWTLWGKIIASGSGEPGVYFSNDKDWGTNPCCEIALRPYQFCNLVTINAGSIVDQADLNERAAQASFLATLQAGYTNFHYLRDIWKKTTEKDALIGVSMTGIASGVVESLDLKQAADWVVDSNRVWAKKIGINVAARTTTVKPEGTSSLVLGCSSGIHAWHNDYYLRRIRIGKNEAIYTYLLINHPELVVDDIMGPGAIIEVPQKAPDGATLRYESVFDLLERVKRFNREWVRTGHIKGQNTHNVSCTISVKDEEWSEVGKWMWENRDWFNGISVLPYDGGTYIQAPFEDISKEEYEERSKSLHEVDLSKVIEMDDHTDLSGEVACGGGACEVK